MPSLVKLNIGTNGTRIPGYLGVDINPEANPDILADLRTYDREPQSVEAIYCSHMLEHFPYNEAELLLAKFAKWLVPDGELYIAVPDFTKCAATFIAGNEKEYIRLLLYGGIGSWDHAHRSGWTESYLRDRLEVYGFEVISYFEPFVKNSAGSGYDASCSYECDNQGNTWSISLNLFCRRIG